MRHSLCHARRVTPPRRERGVVLFVALIVLIVMTLAGLALLRQMSTGVSIAGNIAFKENATSVADRGAEVARRWIVANSGITLFDSFPVGYHSSWEAGIDASAFPWDTQSLTLVSPDQAQTGNVARLIIHRLCEVPNASINAAGQRCSDAPILNAGESKGGGGYGVSPFTTTPSPFYRVTTRVDGPRNTVSYTQVVLQ
jgi:type IV pilus assembly protein PilX